MTDHLFYWSDTKDMFLACVCVCATNEAETLLINRETKNHGKP